MLFKLSNLNSKLTLTLGYLNPALNNSALKENTTKRTSDQFRSLRNCPPTSPLSQHYHLLLNSQLGQNVGLGEGWVGSFPQT